MTSPMRKYCKGRPCCSDYWSAHACYKSSCYHSWLVQPAAALGVLKFETHDNDVAAHVRLSHRTSNAAEVAAGCAYINVRI